MFVLLFRVGGCAQKTAQGDVAQKTYGSALHTAKALMAEGGVPRFFLGIPWRTSRMVLEMFMLDKVKTHTHLAEKSSRTLARSLAKTHLSSSFFWHAVVSSSFFAGPGAGQGRDCAAYLPGQILKRRRTS